MFDARDPAVTRGYSLPQSKHDALKLIARRDARRRGQSDDKANVTRALDDILEEYFRSEFGRFWRRTMAVALTAEEAEEVA